MRRARTWFASSWSSSFLLMAACVSACGGASQPPVIAPSEEPAAQPSASPAASPEPAVAPPSAGEEAAAPATAATPAAPDPNAPRNVTYAVMTDGLKITASGVKFAVSASATQVAAGWGVKLSVVASAVDGKAHSLSSPKSGPLAFAGSVLRKGQSEPEAFGDERTGEGEQSVFGDDVTKFSRTWPAKGVRVLGEGDTLDLQVALWGLGSEKEEHRPVKKFCHVRMLVEKGKPRAIVEPPVMGSGK